MKRAVVGLVLVMLVSLASIGGYVLVTDNVTAQDAGTWQIAGGDQGFPIAEWGTGQGPDVSLDEWIESIPETCDIEILERGAMFRSVMYRCPD